MPKTKERKDPKKKRMTEQERAEKNRMTMGVESQKMINVKSGTKTRKSKVKEENGGRNIAARACWAEEGMENEGAWTKTVGQGRM